MTWQEKVIGVVRLHHATLPMLVAGLEDILLDPVYFRQGRGGLIDLVRKGEFSKQDRIVFLHTGGSAALFGYSGYFRNA